MFADVAIEDGVVRAAFWDYSSPADLTRFIDARVQLRGNIGTIFGRTEQLRGVSLFAGRIEDVIVLEPPPDPFSLPDAADPEDLQLLVGRRGRTAGFGSAASSRRASRARRS